MFERFTIRARKVMALANQAALQFNHNALGTEHILLGLAKEGDGVAANALKNFNVDFDKIRQELEKMLQRQFPGNLPTTLRKLPLTTPAKKLVKQANREAKALHHNYVGPEHLLLGLLRERTCIGFHILSNQGLKIDEVRTEIHKLLGPGIPEPRGWIANDAHQALIFAEEEARQFNHKYLGTAHILLGLIREGQGIGATLLKKMQVDYQQARQLLPGAVFI